MATHFISYFTLTLFLLLFPFVTAVNLTSLLSNHKNFSNFISLLRETSIASDLLDRSSVTILAVPNYYLTNSVLSSCDISGSGVAIHILLQYISPAVLDKISPTGMIVNTLYQSRKNLSGVVNITRRVSGEISIRSAARVATVLSIVATVPNNVIVFAVNSSLMSCRFDMIASESSQTQGTNISKALIDGHAFNVVRALLEASGVVEDLESNETGAGITLFMPTDSAFDATGNNFQSLPAYKKAVVLKFHVLHSYYPLGSLQSIVNPVQPTLATESTGAGNFTLNISKINSSVAISTGIVQATITQTVFDENPLAIFGISRVLLPMEYFGKDSILMQPPGGDDTAPPTVNLLSPQKSPGLTPDSPPLGLDNAVRSASAAMDVLTMLFTLCNCIVLVLSI